MALLQVHQAKALKQLHWGWCWPRCVAGTAHSDGPRTKGDESHGAGPGSDDVHISGPGAPPVADLGGYEGVRQAPLPGLPDLPGRPIRRSGGGLCPTVLRRTEADGGCFVTSCPGGPLLSPPHRRLQPLCLLVAEGALLLPPPPLQLGHNSSLHYGRSVELAAGDRRSPPPPLPSPWSARAGGVPETGDPEPLDPALQEMVTAPLLPPEEGRVENLLFPFCSVPPLTGSVVPKTSIKEQFPFPPGPKRARMAVYETLSPHSRPPLSSPVGSRVRSEDATPSPASPAQLWSQVSVTPHTQTPLRDALPFESGPCAPFRCSTVGTSVTPLVPLVRSLGAWLELPRPSRWLLRTIRLGYTIQFARRPPKFRGIRFTSVLSKDAPVLQCRSRGPTGEGRDRAGPSSRDEVRVLQPLLHRTQERRWVTTNPGPARPEPGPSQAPVQDVDAETHLSMRSSLRLVCSNRPEGRLLPCLDPPSTQTVSPLCVRGASIPVQGPSLRAIPVASCLHQGRRSSPCTVKGSRHSYPQLPRRLAHPGPVWSTVVRTQGYGAQSPQPVGTSGQPGKEQTLPYAEDLFSRHGVGLGQPHSTSLRGACSVNAEMPGVSPAQEGGSTETFSEAPGAYGILSRYHAARIASYETASALASRPSPEMGMAPRHIPGLTHPVLPSHLQPLVGPCVPSGRSSPRASIQAHCCFNRRLCHWAGGPCATGTQPWGSGQGPSCSGISIASSCWQYGLLYAASERCYTRSMYWSTRTTLRPLRTSTTRAVYAPVACRNSPAISSFGVRSIWGRFAPFMSQASSTVQPTSSHVSTPFRENGDSTPRYYSWFGDASGMLR